MKANNLTLNERTALVGRALNVVFRKRMLFGLEGAIEKWCSRLELPLKQRFIDFRTDRAYIRLVIEVGHTRKEVNYVLKFV